MTFYFDVTRLDRPTSDRSRARGHFVARRVSARVDAFAVGAGVFDVAPSGARAG